jgi:hypothetical protein
LPQELVIAVLFFASAAVGGFAVFGARLLLAWYLREIWRADIPQDAEEAIVTYPLA